MLERLRFESKRLRTEILTKEDSQTLFQMYSDAEAMKFRGSNPMINTQDAYKMIAEQYYENDSTSKIRLGIRKKSDNLLIGTVLLKVDNDLPKKCEIGFSFGKEHWRNGYGQETITMIESKLSTTKVFKELIAWCINDNTASLRLFQKSGFKKIDQSEYPKSTLFVKRIDNLKKEKLIVLSDLWGKEKSGWLSNYTNKLQNFFDITYYDCCDLGSIDKSDYSQESLHKQFVTGGIDKAVKKLIEIETQKINILAFSLGGTIAWRYGLKSNNIVSLTCISSTRLRKETDRPEGDILLYYGSDDEFSPKKTWLESMSIKYTMLKDKDHQVYLEPKFAGQLCDIMLKTIPQEDVKSINYAY